MFEKRRQSRLRMRCYVEEEMIPAASRMDLVRYEAKALVTRCIWGSEQHAKGSHAHTHTDTL